MTKVIVTICVYAAVHLLISLLNSKDKKDVLREAIVSQEIKVRMPLQFKVIGIFCSLLFGALLYLPLSSSGPWGSDEWFGFGVLGSFTLLGLVLVWQAYVWKIVFDREGHSFDYTAFSGKMHHIEFSEIRAYKKGWIMLTFRAHGKKFYVDNNVVNYSQFVEKLEKHLELKKDTNMHVV